MSLITRESLVNVGHIKPQYSIAASWPLSADLIGSDFPTLHSFNVLVV
jgi:hypothetical protein